MTARGVDLESPAAKAARSLLRAVGGRGSAIAASGGEAAFAIGLIVLFAISLMPFFFAPSIPLTISLSTLPFILVFARVAGRVSSMSKDVNVERRCLQAFISNSEAYWVRIRSDPNAIIREEDILSLAPLDVRRPSSYAKSLIEDIAKGKLYLIDAPRDAILRAPRDDLESRYRQAAAYGNLSIRLGILGTFFGFVLALSTMSVLFVHPEQQQAEQVHTAIQNLAYAFIKSIYGLIVSIIISIWVSKLRHPLDQLYKQFDDALAFGREFVNRMTLADPGIQSSLFQVRNSLRQVEQQLIEHGATVARSIREHGELMNEQTKTFTQATQGMIEIQKSWAGAFDNLNQAATALDNRTSASLSRMEHGAMAVSEKLESMFSSLQLFRDDLGRTSESLLEVSKKSDIEWGKRFELFLAENGAHHKRFGEWAGIAQRGFDAVREQAAAAERQETASREAREASAKITQSLTSAIGKLEAALRDRSAWIRGEGPSQKASYWMRTAMVLVIVALVAELVNVYAFDNMLVANIRSALDTYLRRSF